MLRSAVSCLARSFAYSRARTPHKIRTVSSHPLSSELARDKATEKVLVIAHFGRCCENEIMCTIRKWWKGLHMDELSHISSCIFRFSSTHSISCFLHSIFPTRTRNTFYQSFSLFTRSASREQAFFVLFLFTSQSNVPCTEQHVHHHVFRLGKSKKSICLCSSTVWDFFCSDALP